MFCGEVRSGRWLPKAHDMAREYRVLKAVHPVFTAAPEVFHLCEDASIIGAVFFVMERRRGIVVRDSIPAELGGVSGLSGAREPRDRSTA